jgi:hypothetical protein
VRVAKQARKGVATVTVCFPGWEGVPFARTSCEITLVD